MSVNSHFDSLNIDLLPYIEHKIDVDPSGKPISYESGEYSPDQPQQTRGKTVSLIPARYDDANAPVLSATVGRQDNDFRFELDGGK